MDFNVIAYRLEMILPSATGQREIEIGRRRELLRKGRTNYNFYTEEKERVSQLVSWYFEPSHSQRITSGLNTNFNLSASHSFHKSLNHKPFFPPTNHSSNYIHNFGTQNQKNNKMLWSLFIAREHSRRETASSRVTYFIR